jgi:hypothetical protein
VTKNNHDALIVIVNKLAKFVMFNPTRTDMDRMETAKKFVVIGLTVRGAYSAMAERL